MQRNCRPILASLCLLLVLAGCQAAPERQRVSLQRLDPSLAEPSVPAPDHEPILRVGSAALISPVETLKSYSALFTYLARTVDRSPEVFQRRTYAETNDLVRTGAVDLALVCSYAYVLGQRDFGMEAIAVPVVSGSHEYFSYIIVKSGSGITSLADLGTTPRAFFRETTFTFSHDNSIQAVVEGLVDGAAVDSLVYDAKIRHNPDLGRGLTIINRSGPFGAPPIVVSPRLEPELKRRLQEALLTLHTPEEGLTPPRAISPAPAFPTT